MSRAIDRMRQGSGGTTSARKTLAEWRPVLSRVLGAGKNSSSALLSAKMDSRFATAPDHAEFGLQMKPTQRNLRENTVAAGMAVVALFAVTCGFGIQRRPSECALHVSRSGRSLVRRSPMFLNIVSSWKRNLDGSFCRERTSTTRTASATTTARRISNSGSSISRPVNDQPNINTALHAPVLSSGVFTLA